jgi:hypothetical protein
MAFELNKELTDATRVIAAASKQQKKLAAVGVTAAEVTGTKKQLTTVLTDRKKHAVAANAAHAETHDKDALTDEGTGLVEGGRRAVRAVLRHDHPADPSELHDTGGIGAHLTGSTSRLQQVAEGLVAAGKDPRWKKALARRGFTPANQKRLAEIAYALDGAAPFSFATDPALNAETRELFRRVSYLREMALAAFGAHSAEYAPFRARAPRPKKPASSASAA